MTRILNWIFQRIEQRTFPNVLVENGVTLDGCSFIGDIKIGFRSYANDSLLRNVTIGRFCSIGRRCSIGAASHSLDSFSTHPFAAPLNFESGRHTVIGNDVWIGDNALVIAGVTIGTGAVVGGGAVVTRDVEPYMIVAGIPARVLRPRFDPSTVSSLLASGWWRFGDAAVEPTRSDRSPRALFSIMNAQAPAALETHHFPYARGRERG